ncbi:MAG: hypothetical protein ABJF23_28100 [Bryobacteraceae bacterium]
MTIESCVFARVIRKLSLVALTSAIWMHASPAQAACQPGPNQASFYVDANFKGACVTRNFGDYLSSGAIGLPNDSISSVMVGANTQVVLCKDNNFGGDCILITQNVGFVNGNRVGNDQVSSLKVQPRGTNQCMPASNQISFYTNADFLGACVVKGLGDYSTAAAIGLPNDSISSVRVGAGAQVIVCKDSWFQGDCIMLVGSVAFLNSHVGNDEISSAKVQVLGTTQCQVSANQAAFFVNADYLGSCVVRNIGDYPGSEAIGLPNDSISSIRVGAGGQAVLCTDAAFRGDCILLTNDTKFLQGDRVGNDEITSAKIQRRGAQECTPANNQVSLFMHADFLAPCVVKSAGSFADSAAIGLDNQSISSIKVGFGVQACLCSLEKWEGDCKAFIASSSFLSEFNDWTSSLRVQPIGAECKAVQHPQGYSQLSVRNCNSEGHTVHLWTRDDTLNAVWEERGILAAEVPSGGCGDTAVYKTLVLTDGHQIEFVAVDPGLIACDGQNDPQRSACQKSIFTRPLLGAKNGPSLQTTVY